jgi:hypothetical protein
MKSLLLAAALALASACVSFAGDLTDAGSNAESQVDAGNFAGALATLNGALAVVWDQSPLKINKALLVASDPQGFGIYDLRDNNRYKSGEPIVLYAEPSGFAYGRDGELYLINMALDFEIKGSNGETLASQQNFSKWELRSRVPNKEFMGKITYNLTGIQPGDYVLQTTIRDLNSEKTVSFPAKFTITE